MKDLAKLTLALMVAGFLSASPVLAAEAAAPAAVGAKAAPAADSATPDLAGGLKEKAAKAIEQGKQSVDAQAQKLQDVLGVNKDSKAAAEAKAVEAKAAEKKATTEAKVAGDKAIEAQTNADIKASEAKAAEVKADDAKAAAEAAEDGAANVKATDGNATLTKDQIRQGIGDKISRTSPDARK